MTFKRSQVCSLSVSYSPMSVSQVRGETKGSAHVQYNRINPLLAFEGMSWDFFPLFFPNCSLSFKNQFFLNIEQFWQQLSHGVKRDHLHDNFAESLLTNVAAILLIVN